MGRLFNDALVNNKSGLTRRFYWILNIVM